MGNISEWFRYRSQDLADDLVEINAKQLLRENISGFGMKGRVIELLAELKAALFPSLYERDLQSAKYLSVQVTDHLNSAAMMLNCIVRDVLVNRCELEKKQKGECDGKECARQADELTVRFMEKLKTIRMLLVQDIAAAYEGDPAARYTEEILLSYPSVEAVSVYRLAHELFLLGVPPSFQS